MHKLSDVVENAYNEEFAAPAFSAGEVLRLTFSVFGKSPALYLGLAFFSLLPGLLLERLAGATAAAGLSGLTNLLFSVIFTGAIAYGVYKNLIGERAGIGEAVTRGLSRYFPLVGTSLLLGLVMIPVGLIAALLGLFGLLIALVLAVYLLCVFAVATPACVVERLGPAQSLGRSAELTKGRRGSACGLIFLGWLATVLGSLAIKFLFPPPFSASLFAPVPEHFRGTGYAVATNVFELFYTAFFQIGASVLYYRLRASREGVSVGKLARVFE